MRIIQLKTSAGRGGAETFLLQLTRAFLDQGHDIHTILGERGWLEDQMQNNAIPLEHLSLTSIRSITQIPKLVRIIRQQQAHVMLIHGARVNLIGAFAARLAGIPSVSVEHNVDSWRTLWAMNAIDRIIALLNAHRIAVSQAVGTMLSELRILPNSKISVIPNGIDFPSLNMIDRKEYLHIRQRFGFSDVHFILCTTARLVEQKGHRYLLDVIPRLQSDFPHIRLLLLGDGSLRSVLEEQAQTLGISDTVHFAGAVDNVTSLLPAFDGFILPSLWEGLPIALLEAMGMGLPVIATHVAGTPEVVTDGDTGILVPPADSAALLEAISRLYTNRELRVAMAQRGQTYVREHHGIEKVMQHYLTVLETVVSPAPAVDGNRREL